MSLEPIEIINKDEGDEDIRRWEDDEDLEETLGERLWGLTEMFPDWLRNGVSATTTGSINGVKLLYKFSRGATWIFFSSAAVLMAPIIFEVERAQMDEMQKLQQRQILLGPSAALTGGQSPFPMPGASPIK